MAQDNWAQYGPVQIVKVQIPLRGDAPALVYAENKVGIIQQEIPEHITAELGIVRKGFFEARWKRPTMLGFSAGRWEIGKRVPDQTW